MISSRFHSLEVEVSIPMPKHRRVELLVVCNGNQGLLIQVGVQRNLMGQSPTMLDPKEGSLGVNLQRLKGLRTPFAWTLLLGGQMVLTVIQISPID